MIKQDWALKRLLKNANAGLGLRPRPRPHPQAQAQAQAQMANTPFSRSVASGHRLSRVGYESMAMHLQAWTTT